MSVVVRRDENGDVDREKTWAFEERRLRRREVLAQELAAIALLADDEDAVKIKKGAAYRRLFDRLTTPNPDAPA